MTAKKRFPAWSTLLGQSTVLLEPRQHIPGWHEDPTYANPVVEPRLHYATSAPQASAPKIVLVAAPGAVGKSTLAKHLAKTQRRVLVDLSETGPIGANFIAGGLYRAYGASAVEAVEAGRVGLVFDALDEAKLRVTAEAFEAFVDDLCELSKLESSLPIVLFGRTATIETTWLMISDMGVESAIAEISFFNRSEAEQFVDKYAALLSSDDVITKHPDAYRSRRSELLDKLKKETAYAKGPVLLEGYAPVLFAMARILADATNYAAPLPETNAKSGRLIETIPIEILKREQTKFVKSAQDQLDAFGISSDHLYSPDEQRYRLLGKVSPELSLAKWKNVSFPSAEAEELYEATVVEFISQHPFLDASGTAIGSAVFEADLVASLLYKNLGGGRANILAFLQSAKSKPNPFLLSMLYSSMQHEAVVGAPVPAECVGPMYESLCARESTSEAAVLIAHHVVDRKDESREGTRIILMLVGEEVAPSFAISFVTDSRGALTFPRGLGDCVISTTNKLVVGDGDSVRLTAPTVIDVAEIEFRGKTLVVEPSIRHKATQGGAQDLSVFIMASRAMADGIVRAPRMIGGASLAVSWPDANRFPWSHYSFPVLPAPKDIEEHRLALRRLILSFRSHSKGALARYVDKIEHFRMTKGDVGDRIREALLKDGILNVRGNFYFLDPDKLGHSLGVSYLDIKAKRFSAQCDSYLRKIG